MKDKSAFAVVGLMCCDCAYFEREGEDGMGACLLSPSFDNVHGRNEVCNAFTQKGCESETEKRAIENLRKQYVKKGWGV